MRTLFRLQKSTMKDRRKQLRNVCTPQEVLLWKKLQGKKLGFKFIRQYSVDNYVLDFYCPSKRLAIELDGSVHSSQFQNLYDKYRTNYLQAFNITVIRFKNTEIENDIQSVTNKILTCLSPS